MSAFPIPGPLGVVLMLLLGGLGAPFPEELVLIGGGVAAHPDQTALFVMMAAGLAGVLAGDLLVYSMGRFMGAQVLRHPILSRHLSPQKLLRFENYLALKGPRFILVLRFMTGLRAPAFFSAGAMRFPVTQFLLYDGLAALVSVPLFCMIGYMLGDQVKTLQKDVSQYGAILLVAALGGFILYLAYRWWRGERGDVEPPPIDPPA